MSNVAPSTPEIEPVHDDGVGAVVFGTIAWSLAAVVCFVASDSLDRAGHQWWLLTAVLGAVSGLGALVFVLKRQSVYAAHRQAEVLEASGGEPSSSASEGPRDQDGQQ